MKVLVAGGCGFIGRNLVEYLEKKDGYDISIVDNLITGSQFQTGATVFHEDIMNVQHISADVVVNFAAQCGVQQRIANPVNDVWTNVLGLANLLWRAKQAGVKRFVHISSFAVLAGGSPYALSKWVGERYCQLFSELYGLETVVLRLSNVYGPGSEHKSSVIAKWMQQHSEGKALTVCGDGSQTRDFLFVGDVVQAVEAALTVNLPEKHMVLPVCTGMQTSVQDVAHLISDRVTFVPRPSGDVDRVVVDPLVGNEILGVSASTCLEDGIKKML